MQFVDQSASSTRMVINSAGNVGIETTTLPQKLNVNGTIRSTGAHFMLAGRGGGQPSLRRCGPDRHPWRLAAVTVQAINQQQAQHEADRREIGRLAGQSAAKQKEIDEIRARLERLEARVK